MKKTIISIMVLLIFFTVYFPAMAQEPYPEPIETEPHPIVTPYPEPVETEIVVTPIYTETYIVQWWYPGYYELFSFDSIIIIRNNTGNRTAVQPEPIKKIKRYHRFRS